MTIELDKTPLKLSDIGCFATRSCNSAFIDCDCENITKERLRGVVEGFKERLILGTYLAGSSINEDDLFKLIDEFFEALYDKKKQI